MSSTPDGKTTDTLRRLLMSAVFASVLYFDFAMIVNLSDLNVRVPINGTIGYYNSIFRVFTNWSDDAYGFVIRVQVTPKEEPDARPAWREVLLHDLLPMSRGESYSRIELLLRRKPEELVHQLGALYQRLNPDTRVHQLRLLVARWPTSTKSFLDRFEERRMQTMAESP